MSISIVRTVVGEVEVRLVGVGKPILFVHGGHVDYRETVFQKGLDPQKFLFIAPSRPGYGSTLLSEINKSPKGTADLFVELLNELKISKVIVVGISAGGLTALEIAGRYTDRVERLILMSALTKEWFNKTDKIYKGAKIVFSPTIERFTWFLYRSFFRLFPKAMAKMMFTELSTYRPVEFTNDEVTELKRMTMSMRSGEGFSNDLDKTIDQEILDRIISPTLILHSKNDNSVSKSHAQNGGNKIRNSEIVYLDNRWGHLLWLGMQYSQVLSELNKRTDVHQ